MKKAVINFKTDEKTKKEAQKVANDMGITLSTVLNASLRDFIEKKSVTISLEPTAYLKKVIQEVEKDINESKNISPGFTTSKEMDVYLDS